MSTGLFDGIRSRYRHFSKGQKRVADYLLAHPSDAGKLSALRLGERAGVSEATVIRFAYETGFSGFPEFQEAVRREVLAGFSLPERAAAFRGLSERETARVVLEESRISLEETLDVLDPGDFSRAAEALIGGLHVFIIGNGSARILAMFFAGYLSLIRENVICIADPSASAREQMGRISPADTCIGISFPRYSVKTGDALEFAEDRGATVILLTDRPEAPAAGRSDILLLAKSGMASVADSLAAPLSVLTALIAAVANRAGTALDGTLRRVEQFWAEDGMYHSEPGGDA